MNTLRQDLRYALRSLGKTRGFTAVVVLTLALTLGANATIFALIDAVLLRPLPFAQPDRLVALWTATPEDGAFKNRVRAMDYLHWRERSDDFDRLALFSHDSKTLTGAGDPAQVFGSRVTGDFFPMLGVKPLYGRVFEPEDYAPGAPPAVVLSHALWSRQLGANPEAVGSTIILDGQSYTVIGVLRRQLMPLVAWHLGRLELGSSQAHYWLTSDAEKLSPRSGVHGVLGRLAEGVAPEQAARHMDALALGLEAEFPATHEGFRVTLVPLLEEAVGDVSTPLWLLLGAVTLTLMIACANVANLFLVRADLRRRDFAVRSALGAGRLRIWRQVTTEGALLALAGAALGALFASWALRLLPKVSPGASAGGGPTQHIPRLDETALDPRALGLTLVSCLLCGLLCTLVPAYQAGRLDLDSVLRAGGRRHGDTGNPRLRRLLVMAEMALAVVLAVGSGLLLRSVSRLAAVDPGFERGHVLTFKLLPHASGYPEMHRLAGFYDRVFAELRAIPGVASVAAAYDHPLDSNWTQSFRLAAGPEAGKWQGGAFRTVTPQYFETLGVERLAGRGFTAGDDAGAPGAVIVNETFVRRHFPDRDPLGQGIDLVTTHWRWGDDAIPSSFRVVGVVEDVRFKGLAAPPEAAFYLPYAQTPHYVMTLLVRSQRQARSLLPEIRARLRGIDSRVPIARAETLDALLASEVAKPRFSALALSGFAAGALLLAVLGIWGVLSYAVRQRVHEIGIRLALGAAGRQVFRWAIWHVLRPVLLGLAVGLAGAAALSRLLRGVLFEISPIDPLTFLAVPVLLLAAAFVACAMPAARAAGTDPMRVLRDE